ncbi:eg45-like domain containing protein [Quercus suber]|uniref:Eg45-like domain containing protein n=1 Tax=Quercus suber TaxID=58331 RepID=A0AAW0J2W8_QUESU
MYTSQQRLQLLPLVIFLVSLFFHFHASYGDVGTAALKSPPYLPTACYGSDESQFPSSNFFAAASDAIWANGTAFGRCITTTSTPYACNQNQTIQVKIVGYIGRAPFAHSIYNATMVLSNTAFGTIANSSTNSSYINIEFEQVHGEDVVPLGRVYVNVICGKLLHTLAITTLYFSGTVADCPFACKCRKNMIKPGRPWLPRTQ